MRLDERGKQCPLPVIEAKKALEASAPGEKVEVVVDNEIAVQNLSKMADHKGLAVCSEKTGEREFLVTITAGEGNGEAAEAHCTERTADAECDRNVPVHAADSAVRIH